MPANIIRALTDKSLRVALTDGALAHASKFTWDRTATILLQTLVESLPR
jgi:hypothetical protein